MAVLFGAEPETAAPTATQGLARSVLLYRQGAGRAAALAPRDDGALEAVAVLGMRWQPGKTVSRRSLRGLRPL